MIKRFFHKSLVYSRYNHFYIHVVVSALFCATKMLYESATYSYLLILITFLSVKLLVKEFL